MSDTVHGGGGNVMSRKGNADKELSCLGEHANEVIDNLVTLVAILPILLDKEMLTKFSEYKKWVIIWGILVAGAWCVNKILGMKKKNYKFLCKCFTVIELLACIVIWGGWLRYTLYPPIVRLSEMDFSSELAYGYDEEEKMLYPKPYCIIDRDGNYAMYVQGFMANEISQSIFVSDIKVNILDYKCAENLFAFTHSILCGGDGDVKDHVYHCVLDSDNQYKKMEYCGDHSLGDVYNDFSFDSSAEHVIIEGDEIGCFNFVFGYKNPGIYKLNYVVDYVANGKEHSIKSKKYEVYLPPISEVNDPGEFDMLDEIYKEEGKYLYDRIDNYYTHPIKLTRKMTEYLEVLRDAQ